MNSQSFSEEIETCLSTRVIFWQNVRDRRHGLNGNLSLRPREEEKRRICKTSQEANDVQEELVCLVEQEAANDSLIWKEDI